MADIGTAFIRILPDTATLNARMGAYFGSSQWGKMGKAAGVALGAGIAAGGAAKALYEVGEAFDEVSDKFRTTGATGQRLHQLNKAFRGVVSDVPADFDTASSAVAGLNQRLEITGKPLERLAKQFAELSRITGTDVETNVRSVTRAFGDWEIKQRKQTRQLDYFFKASQASGSAVSELADQVVQFGAPLRQVGFTLDEATALFAQFEKAGVNTQTMMPGLRLALRGFLEDGIDPAKGLAEAFEGIEDGTIKSAEALEIFGSRAGADMIEAINQGRFDLDKFTKSIERNDDSVREAGRDTMDFAEQWTLFKNNVLVELEPVAKDVFRSVGKAMKQVTDIMRDPKLTKGEKLEKLEGMIYDAIARIAEGAAERAPKVAVAFVKGFVEAPIWAQLVTGGLLFAKLGGSAAFGKLGEKAGKAMGKKMGPALLVGLALIVPQLLKWAADVGQDIHDKIAGLIDPVAGQPLSVSPAFRRWQNRQGIDSDAPVTGRDRAQNRRLANDKIEREEKRHQGRMDEITTDGLRRVTESNKEGARAVEQTSDRTRRRVERNADEQADDGIRHSDRHADATERNWKRQAAAIRAAINRSEGDTRRGYREIYERAVDALENFGISNAGAQKIIKAREEGSHGGFAMGGLAGIVPGPDRGDRHTLSIDGRPIARIAGSEGIFVGNSRMMQAAAAANDAVPRYAGGGWVDPAGPGTGVVNPAIAKVVGAWSRRYDAAINYGYDPGGGHVSPGHNVTGTATDTGPAAGWTGAATALFERGLRSILGKVDQVIYGTAGIGMPLSNHGRGNHAHIEWGMHPAVQAAMKLKLPRFDSPFSRFTPHARVLNQSARALEKIIPRRAGAGGGGDIGPQGGGLFSKSQLSSLWSQTGRNGSPNLMAAIALAESGGDPNVTNSIGARGLWQIIPSTAAAYGLPYGRLTDPTLNARGAHEILAGQGLGAWEAFTNGAYSQYLRRGGIAKLAAGGPPFGTDIPGAPPGFELGKFGKAHLKAAQIPGLRKRLGRILRRIARIDEQIDVAGREAQLTTSPGGAEMTEAEISGQIKLNERLRARLRDALGVAKIGERLGKRYGGAGPFREARLEIAGITGTGGRLLDVREALDALRATEASGAIPGQMDIATFQAFAEAIRLGAFKRGGSVLNFGGGGVVPGPIGRPQAAIVHGGERVSGGGRTYFTITNWDEGSGYFEGIAEDRIAVAERSAYMEDATR